MFCKMGWSYKWNYEKQEPEKKVIKTEGRVMEEIKENTRKEKRKDSQVTKGTQNRYVEKPKGGDFNAYGSEGPSILVENWAGITEDSDNEDAEEVR